MQNIGVSNERTWVQTLSCHVKSCVQICSLYCLSSLGCINEYLAVDSGGYLHMASRHSLIAP